MVCVKWVRNGNLDIPKFKALKMHYDSTVFSEYRHSILPNIYVYLCDSIEWRIGSSFSSFD